MPKTPLFWNKNHTYLRCPQGVPATVPTIPSESTTALELMEKIERTIFHVANEQEKVYLFASAPVDATVFVKVVSSDETIDLGDKTRLITWPTSYDALLFNVKSANASPSSIAHGLALGNGASVSVLATEENVTVYGFAVTA